MRFRLTMFCVLTMILAAFGGEAVWDVSVADFPAQPGEKGDAARIRRAVAAAGSDGVVWFPRGDYSLDETLVVSNGASLLLHKSACLKPLRELKFLLVYWAQARGAADLMDHGLFVRGGVFDGAGLSGGVNLLGVRHFTFADSVFRDCRGVGLQVGDATIRNANGYELMANNLYFTNRRADLAGNVALLTYVGDSHFTDIVAIDWTVGIRSYGGGNRFTRCHTWGGLVRDAAGVQTMLQGSIAFDILGSGESVLDDCYADTAQTGFAVHAAARLLGCSYLNDYRAFKMDDVAVIRHYRGDLTVSDGRFRDCGTPKAAVYVREEGLRGQDVRRLKWRDNCVYGFTDAGLADLRTVLATPAVPVDR